jgi:hypothetical protein
MPSYKYHVVKGNRTVALATTKREAEAEARRVGGKVVEMRVNPWQPELSSLGGYTHYVGNTRNKAPEGIPKDAPPDPAAYEYAFTILAPKCLVPVAIYVDRSDYSSDYEGWTPDGKRHYADAYLDTSETNSNDCSRQHMSPGLRNKLDKGTGVGSAMYMAGPIVEIMKNRYGSSCVFSPAGDSGRYTSRSGDASRAWSNLVNAGVASKTTEYVEAENDYDVTAEMLENEYNLSNVQTIHPDSVTVYSEEEIKVQEMYLDSVLREEILLHASSEVRSRLENKTSETKWCPHALAFAMIDFTHCTMADVEAFINFCSEDMGDMLADRAPYKKEALAALIQNPNKPQGYVDPRQLKLPLGAPVANPRRRNPAEDSWVKRITSNVWGDE